MAEPGPEHPENGWSLFGLMSSLRAQGKDAQAAAVERRFARAWANADVALTGSRFMGAAQPEIADAAASRKKAQP